MNNLARIYQLFIIHSFQAQIQYLKIYNLSWLHEICNFIFLLWASLKNFKIFFSTSL